MKFVCDKCRTKYSIADEKVRRKVLKIRCKNCSNIIVVREPTRGQAPKPAQRRPQRALEQAFDGAFSPRASSGKTGPVRPAAAVAVARDREEEFAPVQTKLAPPPEHLPTDEEWFLAVDGHQFGPMSFSELSGRVKRGEARSELGEEAFVWRDGFDDWLEVNRVSELRPYVPPPPPPKGRSGLFPLDGVEGAPPPSAPAPPPGTVPPSGPPGGQRSPAPRVAAPVRAPSRPDAPLPQVSPLAGAPGLTGPELPSVLESGLRQIPGAFPAEGPVPAPALSPPAPSKMSMLYRVGAVCGIASTLIGIGIVVYVLVFDRPATQEQPEALATRSAMQLPAVPEGEEPDAGPGIEFPPMEVRRSPGVEKEVQSASRSRRPREASRKGAEEQRPKLTAEQRRLLALYGEGGTGGKDVPVASTAERRRRTPMRPISSTELGRVQSANERSLKACYERALKRDPTLSNARADVQVQIGDSGIVQSVEISGVDSIDLKSCLTRSVKRWVFPAAGAQAISFPLIFRGS